MVKQPPKLQLYKSGFVGLSALPTPTTARETQLRTIDNMMVQLTTSEDPLKSLVSSPRIQSLGGELLNTYSALNNFKKRHAFLEELLGVLPTANYAQWCMIQAESPLFSETHRDFLEDTARYVLEGNRRMNIHNWVSLFGHHRLEVRSKPAKFSGWFMDELKQNYSAYRFTNFYSKWQAKRDGAMDLVKTFTMIYG